MRLASLLLLLPALALGAFNETRAVQYAELAGAAYCKASTLEAWDCGSKCFKGVDQVKVCQGSSTQAFVGIWDGKCMASFEGTNGMASVKVDMEDTIKVPLHCDGCWVHRGFLNEWNSLATCVKESFKSIGCGPKMPIRATGHSLGGAVVALAMFDLKWNGWEVDEVYNFGSPRVGNKNFVAKFDEMFTGRFFRVTHGQDPFIDMPLGPFYVHVEPEVFYIGGVKDGYRICTDPFDKACSAQYFPDFKNVFFASGRAWHHNYMDVATTGQGCRTSGAKCGYPIEGSWCSYGIPCNVDQRGAAAYCVHGSALKMGYGKCWCHEGFCPSNDGKCVPDPNLSPKTVMLSTSEVEESPSRGEVPVVMVLFLAAGLLLGSFAMRMKRQGDVTPDDFYIQVS